MEQKKTASLGERIGMTIFAMTPTSLVSTLTELDETGVDHVWVPFGPPWSADLVTVLSAAAARTSRLKLGTAIVPVYSRHPVLLALQALSFEHLAPGRLRLGVGVGSPELAKIIYGEEMEPALSYLREYVQVLRPLLTEGSVKHKGKFFTAEVSLHATTQIPIYVAALGPSAFRLAGEIADGVLPYMSPAHYLLEKALPALQEGASAAGRPRPPVIAHVPVALTKDRTAALEAGRKAVKIYTTYPVYRNMFFAAGFSEVEVDAVADTLLERLLIFGDEDTVGKRLQELLAQGLDELTVGPVAVVDAAEERQRLARLIGQL
ncbi:F420-dependent oxidoreductase-like protein [Thermosporothrix hazakensis]|jgi:F420-dependent oxidoreductase-like protein|uniref:F420-dependent oxidoreductase-like protein n=1 Tax=Thermosporothrix hazakensis TaxID=644383 RepID=A0A326TQF7_THEHA|nr:LLM class flavin-dependent oxidoreductase [Thermosporothrix hazakensis]PZW18319.1 F420-dependent oxidoreductase-like protein [Thermosporothrix hazakensis]GCE51445.1 LLM class F420-dependent oxidoreductase [Thermosporothrix hazakensis]